MDILSNSDKKKPVSAPQSGRSTLVIGGLAAILASTCCLGPLVLLILGFSGAWIANLTVLEPYRPFFIGTALVALFFAYRRIFQRRQACRTEKICAVPQRAMTSKIMFWLVAALTGIALAFPSIVPLFY